MAAVHAPLPVDGFGASLAVPAAAYAIAPLFAVQAEPCAALLAVIKTQRASPRQVFVCYCSSCALPDIHAKVHYNISPSLTVHGGAGLFPGR